MRIETEEKLQWLAFAALWPIFGLQALWLRKTITRLPEPPCPRRGRLGRGEPLRVLILGDSAGAGVGAGLQAEGLTGRLVAELETEFEIVWTIHAKTGWTTKDCLDHLDTLAAQPFDAVVTSLGVNDATGRVPRSTWIAQQECLVWRVRQCFGNPHLFLSGVPPIRQFPGLPQPLRWWLDLRAGIYSRTLEQWCSEQSDCTYIRLVAPFSADMMAADGFHPGPPVYKIWAGLVAQAMRVHFAPEKVTTAPEQQAG